jgi:(1->4)-alpha-D-glucan 1-alpha-D-glucosylmutase
MQIPCATYRLQFNEHFRLTDALALVPYLRDLGISHIYASPLFRAVPHSTHGYDVCDFTRLNPEIGTEADLEKLAKALHGGKMGLVLDIVPNHMGIASPENVWWWDVLKNGRASKFAKYFDIDWNSPDPKLRGKILVPILGGEYERILERGELLIGARAARLRGDEPTTRGRAVRAPAAEFILRYRQHEFPLAPDSISKSISVEQFNSNPAALDGLIQRQNYRLAFWRDGDRKINYRRFFAVSALAALRIEDEKIFNDVHTLVRKWIENGWLDGLRVDHPDGLRDPVNYLQRLRAMAPRAWIVVEKILQPEEQLPVSWPVQGTTGYDFLNQVNGLFIDAAGEKAFTSFYAEFTAEPTNYAVLVREKKRAVLKMLFAAESNRLADLLFEVAARRNAFQKLPRAKLQEALSEVIICFPVYRSYITGNGGAVSAADLAAIKSAVHPACEERNDLSPEMFAYIHALLLKPQRGKSARQFIARFQQLTGPVMAKGVEDTASYCFNRFASLNEVGGDPGTFGVSVDGFHRFLQRQRNDWPHSQLATSTHDTKRAEDVRARLNVLSEIPEIWAQTVRRWSIMNACHRQNDFPDRNAEYLFYQTLAGAWPLSVERAQFYMEKAAHESKQHTTWTNRNALYEKALRSFVFETMSDAEFTADLERFTGTLANAATVNSLAQTLVKLTAPGVPDIYQGCELWDWSLVDPDNRRPVDFNLRQRLLVEMKSLSVGEIWERRAEGLPKLWVIQKTLELRARLPDFSDLTYQPLFARGAKAEHIVAFSRGGKIIAVVPRFLLKLKNDWQGTSLDLPPGNWSNEFAGENHGGEASVERLLQKFPVALLARKENG